MQYELSDQEIEFVLQLVDRRLHELGPEINHTDSRDYRNGLMQEQATLSALQQRLAGSFNPSGLRL